MYFSTCPLCGEEFVYGSFNWEKHNLDELLNSVFVFFYSAPKPEMDERDKKLMAFATQDVSPMERDIARNKLREKGLWK